MLDKHSNECYNMYASSVCCDKLMKPNKPFKNRTVKLDDAVFDMI